jgi:RecB family exonuclease
MTIYPPDFRFSQSNLQDYRDCARRFELRYLQRRHYPAPVAEPLEQLERQRQRGEDFHRLVQQHQLGIDEAMLSRSIQDEDLQGWWQSYLQFAAQHLSPSSKHFTELALFTEINGHRITAKYDLIVVSEDGQLLIYDWKTSEHKPKRERLSQRMQTVIYPFVLVEAGRRLQTGGAGLVDPSSIQMCYWFTAQPDAPEIIVYSAEQYAADRATLAALMAEIDARTYFEKTQDVRHCKYCVYRSLCDRGQQAGDLDEFGEFVDIDEALQPPDISDLKFDFDQIAEIEF